MGFDGVTGSQFVDLGLSSQHVTDILSTLTLKSRLVWMINIMMLQCLKVEGGEPVEKA